MNLKFNAGHGAHGLDTKRLDQHLAFILMGFAFFTK
ncbi:hypothetical protein X474_15720 [Dethiosulfatarculus sandiegensis]|uniref:Uncharacterized protein n=1 Tax=Dethiosulfatarculus sandiegensis TaxID=1429043 RepID=A0A0D2GDW2_9BACT|nr:hypothetical protein X474_15720 [Dethiosulfatarculus sandiegensis]